MSKISKTDRSQSELFRNRLSRQLNPKHELMILSESIDWQTIETQWGDMFDKNTAGRSAKPARLVAGLLILQHTFNLSDDEVVRRWVENPYYQYFCGFDYLQWSFPLHSSSLTRWRKRLGKSGMDALLQMTIDLGIAMEVIKEESLQEIIVDTTVQEKHVAHPTDSKLMDKARKQLVSICKAHNVPLRQNYNRVSKQAVLMAGRYAHANQFKRMRKQVKSIKNYLGRVVRDIERAIKNNQALIGPFEELLNKAKRLLSQDRTSKDKLYSLHEPDVVCIAKGKAKKKYEFGNKVSLAVTHKEGFALCALDVGNAYDGHTLQPTIQEVEKQAFCTVKNVFVDKGYKGHAVTDLNVHISGTRTLSKSLKRKLKRRSMIEAMIGHMKTDGKLALNRLKGKLGDQINATLCAVGHNIRLILNAIIFLCKFLINFITDFLKTIDVLSANFFSLLKKNYCSA